MIYDLIIWVSKKNSCSKVSAPIKLEEIKMMITIIALSSALVKAGVVKL